MGDWVHKSLSLFITQHSLWILEVSVAFCQIADITDTIASHTREPQDRDLVEKSVDGKCKCVQLKQLRHELVNGLLSQSHVPSLTKTL